MRKENLNILAAVSLFMMTLAGQAADGATIHVPADFTTIQAAIDGAANGDEIEVSPGTYYEAIDFKGKAARLYSSGGQEVTTIDGTGHYHVLQCISGEDANTILEGFTITGGSAIGDGSGYPYNHTYHGGGMRNYFNSSPTVTNCTFSNNTATELGGGMYKIDSSSPTETNCTFRHNSAWSATKEHIMCALIVMPPLALWMNG